MVEHEGKTFVKKNRFFKIYDEPVNVVLKKYESKLKRDVLKDFAGDVGDLWSSFYDSQYIKKRKNHRQFHHFIPKYLKNIKGLKKEFSSLNPCKKITDF